MTVVLDSNVVVALVTKDERAAAVGRQMQRLGEAGEVLHAPFLLRYEVANALTRKVVAGELDLDDAETAWHQIADMPIALHDLDHGPESIEIALKLRRESAYDASYIALAQELDADLLTLDGPLARNAAGAGFHVELIDVSPS